MVINSPVPLQWSTIASYVFIGCAPWFLFLADFLPSAVGVVDYLIKMISPVLLSVIHSISLSDINKLYISIVYCALVPFLKCAVIVFAGLGLKAVSIKKLFILFFVLPCFVLVS